MGDNQRTPEVGDFAAVIWFGKSVVLDLSMNWYSRRAGDRPGYCCRRGHIGDLASKAGTIMLQSQRGKKFLGSALDTRHLSVLYSVQHIELRRTFGFCVANTDGRFSATSHSTASYNDRSDAILSVKGCFFYAFPLFFWKPVDLNLSDSACGSEEKLSKIAQPHF
jgi:hypothetical protein